MKGDQEFSGAMRLYCTCGEQCEVYVEEWTPSDYLNDLLDELATDHKWTDRETCEACEARLEECRRADAANHDARCGFRW